MRAVALDIIQKDLPGSARRIITQGDLAPPTERANDFDRRRSGRLPGRDRPTEHFREAEPLLAFSSLVESRNCRCDRGLRRSCHCPALAFNGVGDSVNHNVRLLPVAPAFVVGRCLTLPRGGVEGNQAGDHDTDEKRAGHRLEHSQHPRRIRNGRDVAVP